MAGALNVPIETLMGYVGAVSPSRGTDTESAIRQDGALTDAQKAAMLEIYRGFTGGENKPEPT